MTIKPAGWMAIALVGAAGVLLWSAHASDPGSVSWTDPEQPPAMVALPVGRCGERAPRPGPRRLSYPDSLSAWGDSVVGDC